MPFIGKTPTRVPLTSADIQDGSITASDLASGVGKDINWQSSIVTGSTLSATAGNGYWIDTTSNACTVTLPANASVGDQIIFSDYKRTWGTNAVTINQNSLNFQGYSSPNPVYNTSGQSVTIVYSGSTQGWIPTVDDDVTDEVPQTYSVDFLVIAGGGGGGKAKAAGGGAGGYRNSYNSESSGGGGSAESSLTFGVGTVYTITVGAGGAGKATNGRGNNGNDSSISGSGLTTITSTAGGGGGGDTGGEVNGNSGGSGGGASGGTNPNTAGSGTANQGYAGGGGYDGGSAAGGGGGGASAVGQTISSDAQTGGNGGNGVASTITGSSVTRAGGGGGCNESGGVSPAGGSGGTGGGGAGAIAGGTSGTANTGGGGGAGQTGSGGNGGSGVVILRMADADYSGTTTGSPTVNTNVGGSGETVLIFNASGSYTG